VFWSEWCSRFFLFFFPPLSIHYMGRRFLYSDLTHLHIRTPSNVSKQCVQNRTKVEKETVDRFSSSPITVAGGGAGGVQMTLMVLDSAQKLSTHSKQ
jgi:hypothetical protein